MNPSTLERALFEWPRWRESIVSARVGLGYSPFPEGDQLARWQWDHNSEAYATGIGELEKMGLPGGPLNYWMACFYAEYTLPNGAIDYDSIRDVFFAPQGSFGEKLYPQAWKLTAPSVRQPYGTTSIGTPFSLEGTLELASGDILKEAIATLRDVRKSKGRDHPLLKFVNSAKVRPQERKREAIRRLKAQAVDFEGLLREEWQTGDVQAELQRIHQEVGNNATQLKKRIAVVRRRVYNRVANWLRSEGIEPPKLKEKGAWARLE